MLILESLPSKSRAKVMRWTNASRLGTSVRAQTRIEDSETKYSVQYRGQDLIWCRVAVLARECRPRPFLTLSPHLLTDRTDCTITGSLWARQPFMDISFLCFVFFCPFLPFSLIREVFCTASFRAAPFAGRLRFAVCFGAHCAPLGGGKSSLCCPLYPLAPLDLMCSATS